MPKKRKDGRYQSSVTITNSLTGEKKKIYVYGYTEAELIREKEKIKRNNGNITIGNTHFKDWIDEWLAIKKDDLAKSTLDDYKKRIDKTISPYLDDFPMKNITPAMIRKVLRNIEGDRNKQYTYILLHAIFQQAYVDEIIDRNPCIAVKKPKYKAQEKQIITPDIFKKILTAVTSKQQRNIFILAMYTGMRRGEICALKWKNIDFNKGLIKVTSAIKKTTAGLIYGKTKTENSKRNVLISKNVIDVLHNQLHLQDERYLKNGAKVTSNDFVFTSELIYNAVLPPDTITNNFARTKKHAGINENISFHSFRHTHTTMLVESHIPIKAVQMRLGHSTAAFTMQQYAHNTDKMQREIVDLLDHQQKII